jgi:AcrR family transcriptional regulator
LLIFTTRISGITMATRSASALIPRKAPRQSRSQATVEVILEAATRVLAKESLAGFNTNRVAEVAGISIGSLYQYFPNKAALTAALIERAQSSLIARVEAITSQTASSLHAHVALLVAGGIDNQFGQSSLAAALDHEELRLQQDPVMAGLLAKARHRLIALVMDMLAQHEDELKVPLSESTAADVLVIAKSLIEAQAELSAQPSPDLAARVERAVLGYLCC